MFHLGVQSTFNPSSGTHTQVRRVVGLRVKGLGLMPNPNPNPNLKPNPLTRTRSQVTCYSQNYSAISEKITVANGYGAAPNSEVAANGRCGLQRARLDRAEPPGPAPEVQN